ncbi:dihydrofolate reductase [Naumannella sp. ID2617S]|uniref:Deaminase n=1 Tax=Enemella dayhoffiae TaxID=2016507 RepID=A0A255H8T9_9ACTN|nr:dihydrofolate reductase family protein [Enemella dayhoffiae]NNG19618.1 dihydrofolate reductase [Naumannella sp. ID2617S]OYO24170.1 deaminase [Enemella dayhoffiae]
MTRYRFYTATTLDGYLADENDSLDWLFTQPQGSEQEQRADPEATQSYPDFIAGVGALAMGATTYQWVLDEITAKGEQWPYSQPCLVFTHRRLEPAAANVRLVQGSPAAHRAELEEAAQDKDVWVVGGGDLACQFAEEGMLDDLLLSIAPVTLGAGRPLFPRAFDLELVRHGRNGAFLCASYRVVGARRAS